MTTGEKTNVDIATGSIPLLAQRLQRLEFLLTGSSDLDGKPSMVRKPASSDETLASQLASLQRSLDKLRRGNGQSSDLIRDVEALKARFPELFSTQSLPTDDSSTQASVVLSHATYYPETASRLSSLQTLQIPRAEQSAKLNDLSSLISDCRQQQDELDTDVQDLRQRSARCLEWWVRVGVVGMGDLCEEWESRMLDIERRVAQFERREEAHEGYI